jgi:hypothetical protein
MVSKKGPVHNEVKSVETDSWSKWRGVHPVQGSSYNRENEQAGTYTWENPTRAGSGPIPKLEWMRFETLLQVTPRKCSSAFFLPLRGASSVSRIMYRLWHRWPPENLGVPAERGITIDFICKKGQFPVSASCVTLSNSDSLSIRETGAHSGIRNWK